MTPAEYVEVAVMPTVREFMQKPGDRRLAYLSAIATFHIPDYLSRAAQPGTKAEVELKRIRDVLRSDLTIWYDATEGMANGAKHCGRDPNRGAPFTPGNEEYVPAFAADKEGSSADQGRLDGPGLRVPVGGDQVFVDNALGYFLLACARHFPDHIPSIQPSDWDPKFRSAVWQMPDDEASPIREAATALRPAGIAITPIGDELDRRQVGDLVYSDSDQ